MGKGMGKKKIEIKRVENQERRMVTFSKRRQGLFKKAQQLHALTGSHIAVLAFSPAGRPYTHCSSSSFDAIVDRYLKLENQGGGEEVQEEAMVHDLSSWSDAMMIGIEGRDRSAEELIFLKNILGEIRGKVAQKIQEDSMDVN